MRTSCFSGAAAVRHARMRKYTTGIVLCALLAFIVVAVARRAGRLDSPTLSGVRMAAVNEVEIGGAGGAFVRLNKDKAGRWQAVSSQGVFEPDVARIEEFISVFNLWEIAFIPTDSQASVWREIMEKEGGKVRLRTGRQTVFKIYFVYRDNLFMMRRGRKCYAMQSPWQTASWPSLFNTDAESWRSSSVLDLDYLQVKRVAVSYSCADSLSYCLEWLENDLFGISGTDGLQDTVDAALSRAYLTAFKGVYFDFPALDARLGKPLYHIEVQAKDGRSFDMSVFEKQTEAGSPDLFKAMVLIPRLSAIDTVELSYAVLDKMAKTRGWFGFH